MRGTARRSVAVGLWAVLAIGCGGGSEPAAPAGRKLTIAVIPKGTTHEFWKSIHAGAQKAAGELSRDGRAVEILWKGPLREDDREQQVQVVESFTSQGVDGIVLAPLDASALVRPVEEARRLDIPTVIFDSGLKSEDIVSYVATDNFKGGELAAERLGSLMGGKGKALLLRYQEGSASTDERQAGFETKLASAHPGVQLVSSDQYSGPTRDTAKRASENLLNRFGTQVQGIFTPNESSSMGMLLALQDAGLAGKLSFVGFDASPVFVEAMRKGQMHGTVLQNPFNMGYLAVKTMVEHLEGKQVPKVVDTGVALVTPDNLDDPRSQELLNPPQAAH
ncbi:MAG TPA: substrate-binding domain-containing protein [Vicinamibacteria bacterium]|nr:substrate-binding domain-containing protein [Vicinamibacteria bacterium]